ncbi:hypothetical protein [Oribacterium sp. NK2B42]|uniref:hypothetical protein n=1 Tax=Oribacterium sp. NK2B42 TaxID=689781 RepID=UPI00041D6725|nr:hypothetical protein [Oribacterium sp. NK2B42]
MKKMNLIKKIVATATIAALSVSMFAGTAVAGQFIQDEKGIWYKNDDGTFPKSVWQWIDADGDGQFLCYGFDENGYVYSSTTTPDGYTTAADGSWIQNGVAVARTALENLDTNAIVDAAAKTAQMIAESNNKASKSAVDAINGIKTNITTEDKVLKVGQLSTHINSSDLVVNKHIKKTITEGAAGIGVNTEEDDGPDMSKTSYDTNGPSVPAGAVSNSVAPLTDTSTVLVPGPDGQASDGTGED